MASATKGNEKVTREPVHHVSNAEPAEMSTDANPQQTGGQIVQAAMNQVALTGDDALGMFAEDANRGMEGATEESFAIPFLIVLQKGSPQVDEQSGVALEGARQGMLFNTVTGDMHDVRPIAANEKRELTPLSIVPCAYRRTWIRWGSRKNGGGFKGELTDAQVAEMRRKGELKEVDGKLLVPDAQGALHDKCDVVNDHRNHYVLILGEDDTWQPALMSLTSTQIKKSKNLMAALAGVKMKHPTTGQVFQPPSWANIVKVTTQPEQNDKGSWMGLNFALSGKVSRRDIYEAAKTFNESIRKGAVSENYNNLADNAPADSDGEGVGQPSAGQPEKF